MCSKTKRERTHKWLGKNLSLCRELHSLGITDREAIRDWTKAGTTPARERDKDN